VLGAVTKTAQDLSTAGKLPGQLDAATIATMIETVVQNLKSAGVLNPNIKPADAVPTATAKTYQIAGTVTLT
jgi:hypothetical protein